MEVENDEICAKLLQWSDQTLWSAKEGLTKQDTATTGVECSEKTADMMESTLWVSIVRYLDTSTLES